MGMSHFSILDAPSILGLRPTGVENLPAALKAAGLLDALNAQYLGRVQPLLSYSSKRDKSTQIAGRPSHRDLPFKISLCSPKTEWLEIYPLSMYLRIGILED